MSFHSSKRVLNLFFPPLLNANTFAFFRDAEDHIAWLLQHGWHEKALAAVEAGQGRSELLDEVFSLKCCVVYNSGHL